MFFLCNREKIYAIILSGNETRGYERHGQRKERGPGA